ENGLWFHLIMLDLNDGLPIELRRVTNNVYRRLAGAIEDDIEPIVALESLCGAIFIRGEGYFRDRGASLNLHKPDFDRRPGIFGMRTPRDEIEAAVVLFYAFHFPAARALIGNYGVHGDTLDFIVAHQGRNARRRALRMRQNPRRAVALYVADRAVAFFL